MELEGRVLLIEMWVFDVYWWCRTPFRATPAAKTSPCDELVRYICCLSCTKSSVVSSPPSICHTLHLFNLRGANALRVPNRRCWWLLLLVCRWFQMLPSPKRASLEHFQWDRQEYQAPPCEMAYYLFKYCRLVRYACTLLTLTFHLEMMPRTLRTCPVSLIDLRWSDRQGC